MALRLVPSIAIPVKLVMEPHRAGLSKTQNNEKPKLVLTENILDRALGRVLVRRLLLTMNVVSCVIADRVAGMLPDSWLLSSSMFTKAVRAAS